MNVKELFDKAENGTLTWEQFQAAATANNAKFFDLSEGNYVSKSKYTDDIAAKTSEIDTLNTTIQTRDADLADLKSQLEAAGVDSTKLNEVTNKFNDLQTKYNDDTKAYKELLKKQAYEFAVKEFAGTKNFTSQAAKRDFIQSMIAKELKMDNEKILGAEDFVTAYTANNADAFVTQQDPEPKPKPTFVSPTQGGLTPPPSENAFLKAFKFTGVRPIEEK